MCCEKLLRVSLVCTAHWYTKALSAQQELYPENGVVQKCTSVSSSWKVTIRIFICDPGFSSPLQPKWIALVNIAYCSILLCFLGQDIAYRTVQPTVVIYCGYY